MELFGQHFMLMLSPKRKRRKISTVPRTIETSHTKNIVDRSMSVSSKVKKQRKINGVPLIKENKSLSTRKIYDSHLLYTCDVCSKVYKTKNSIRRHINIECGNVNQFQCKKCKKIYSRYDTFLRHKRYECGSNRKFVCDLCDYSAKRKTRITEHIKSRHTNAIKVVNKVDYDESDGIFKCDKCQKSYTRKDTLRRHILHECEAVRRYVCDLCKMPFRRKQHLNQHIAARHLVKNMIKCSKCDKHFISQRGLDYHVKLAICEKSNCIDNKANLNNPVNKTQRSQSIVQTRLHKCQTCHETFTTKRSYLYHNKISCSCNKSTVITCKKCEYSTNLQSELDNHVKLHHSVTLCLNDVLKNDFEQHIASHECVNCNKAFLTQKGLRIHLRTCGEVAVHSFKKKDQIIDKKLTKESSTESKHDSVQIKVEEKMKEINSVAECMKCGEGFTTMQHFKLHIRRNCTESSITFRDQHSHSTPEEINVSYECTTCKKIFNKKKHMRHHAKYTCDKLPNIYCKICSYSCKLQRYLDLHMKTKHAANIQASLKKDDNSKKDIKFESPHEHPKYEKVKADVKPEIKKGVVKRVKCIKMITMKTVKEKKSEQKGDTSMLYCKECDFSCKKNAILHNHVMMKHRLRNVYKSGLQN